MSTIIPGLNPIDFSDVYDSITFNDVIVSPGQLLGFTGLPKKSVAWDVKDGNGQTGASITKKGGKLAKFTATFLLCKDPGGKFDDFADYDVFLPLMKQAQDGTTVLVAYHPDLAELDIDSVVVEDISARKHLGNGGDTVDISFIEYKPPKKAGGTPQKKKGNDPNEDLKKEIDALTKEAMKP